MTKAAARLPRSPLYGLASRRVGTRLQSQVCDTQVIVVKSADSVDDLRCGGAPMVPIGDANSGAATIDPAFADNKVMGKRHVDEAGAEVLITKAGAETLAVKEGRPLPASE